MGKRLGYLTKNNPKCLVKINDKDTILDHQLKNLITSNLKEIIMPTGPFEEKIKNHVKTNYPTLKVQYIHNPLYHKTNYIFSVYLLKNIIDDDVILLHGDLIFSKVLLEEIINSKDFNCVLVNKEIPPPEKDFKALIIDEKIIQIGVNVSGSNSAFLAPLYKLTKQFFNTWLNQIEKFINDNRVNCYAEDALNEILNKLILKPFYFQDKICKEIDDIKDLEFIKKNFKENNKI